MTVAADAAPSRSQRYRQRKKAGDLLLSVTVTSEDIDRVVAAGMLDPGHRGDRDAVAAVFCQLAGEGLHARERRRDPSRRA